MSMFYEWFSPARFVQRPNIGDIDQILGMVPDDASVMMPSYMLDIAKPTQRSRAYYQVYYENEAKPREEYVIIDKDIVSATETREGRQRLQVLIDDPANGYELITQRGNLELYRWPGGANNGTS
jgi:hypothetical protein